MKHGLKQTLRLVPGILLLGVAAASVVAGIQWMSNHEALPGPAGLSWEATPTGSYVSFPLAAEDADAVYQSRWKEDHLVLAVGEGSGVLVRLAPQAHRELISKGRLLIQGMVTQGLDQDVVAHPDHPAAALEGERHLMVLHRGQPYPVFDGLYILGIGALALLMSLLLLRSFVGNRHPREPAEGWGGLFERLAVRYPGVFAALGRYQINGFGLELVDFHDARSDGSFLATRWMTVGFLPVAPIRLLRIRSLTERVRLWIPFVATATAAQWETLESLPVDRSRSLRVYLFYYFVFLPLAVGPLMGLFLWFVLTRPDWSAGVIWGLIGACLAWGVAMVWMQDRVMKRPGRSAAARLSQG